MIATTPTQSLAGVVAKIAVILREATDNTDLCEFPLPHIRSALADLRRLTHEAKSDQTAGWPAGDQSIGALFEQSHRPSPPGAPLAPGARAMMRPVAAGRIQDAAARKPIGIAKDATLIAQPRDLSSSIRQ